MFHQLDVRQVLSSITWNGARLDRGHKLTDSFSGIPIPSSKHVVMFVLILFSFKFLLMLLMV